jgi:hypothetical protein
MKNYLLPDGWNEHFTEMENLESAKGSNMFCVMEYIAPMPCCEQVRIIAHANSLKEVAGYFRYRVVRDMIWIVQKNPDFEPEELDDAKIDSLSQEQKEKAAEPIRFWRLLGECFEKDIWEEEFLQILEEFNNTFPHLDYCTYSFTFFKNADELRKHFVESYSEYVENIDEELSAICSIKSFDGDALAKYLDDMFC